MNRTVTAIIFVIIGLFVGPIWYLEKAFWVTSSITIHQVVFWSILILTPLVTVFICKYIKTNIYVNWKIAFPIWSVLLFVYYTTGLFYFSGIADKCTINAQAVSGEWEESYTEWRREDVCDSRDKDGNCTSSHTVKHCDDYNSDSYVINFSDGSNHSVNTNNYRALVNQFKNQTQVPVTHFDQCSVGDGRKFVTTFQSGKSAELYVSYEIPVVNYILAGHNLYQTSNEVAKPYLSNLQSIPRIIEHEAGIGPWKSNRLLISSVSIPNNWTQDTERWLNKLNGVLGPVKQINVVLYIVGSTDRAFSTALEHYWVHGKKNQLTVVIGSTNFPKIEWVDVIDFWSENPEIRINIRDSLQNITLDDAQFNKIIESEIKKNWKRREMKSLKYLAWDLTIPIWSYLLIISCVFGVTVFFTRTLSGISINR